MVISVVLMALGSFMIAALPSKDTVGDLAIILLLIARLIQGLSVGGEYGIAATYRFLLIFSVCNPNRWSTFGRCKH